MIDSTAWYTVWDVSQENIEPWTTPKGRLKNQSEQPWLGIDGPKETPGSSKKCTEEIRSYTNVSH